MKKKILSICLVLLIMVSLIPSASAGWEGWVSCMVGDHVYYYVGSVEPGALVSTSGMPAGLTLAEESGGSSKDLYLSGYPMYAGDYMVWISATDGRSFSCEVVVDSVGPAPGPVTAPPYVSWTSNNVRCSQGEDVYISVGVVNDGGWDLYYQWYKNGNSIYGADSASFYCDTSSARKDVYQCKIDAWKGNSNVTLWSNEIWVEVVGTYVSAVSVFSLPYKTDYTVNDYLNTDGLGLTVIYNTGYQEKIYKGYSCSPTTLSKTGTQKITVSYGGCSTSFNVNVKDSVKVSSISIDTSPDKVRYFIGEKLDPKGLGVLCTYTNGGQEYIYSGLNCSPTSFDTAGTQVVTVSYGGKTCTFTVEVNDAYTSVDMAVVTLPAKTEYVVGDTLDPAGLTLSVDYMGGDHVIIDSNNPYITIEPKTFSEPGQQKITITLLEESHLSCDFTVNVKEKEEPLPSETPTSSEAPKEEPAENTPAAPTAEPAEKAESTASPVLWYVIGALILIILILIVCIIILQKQNAERIELMRRKRRRARRIAEEQRRYSDNNDEL